MTSTSLIPDVLDALIASLTAALPSDFTVVDGPPTVDIPATGLYLGASSDDNKIDFQQEWAGLGGLYRNESFQIPNLLYLRSGDPGMSAIRRAVFTNLALIEETLRADPTLGISGHIVRAQFGVSGALTQVETTKGCVCLVEFSINVETRI